MIRNIPLGVYVPGVTAIHRMPPLWKFLVLFAFIISTSIVVKDPRVAAALVLVAAVLYAVARIPVHVAWGQLWPSLPLLIILGLFQWWQKDFSFALNVTLLIFSSLMMAMLLTLTTKLAAIMEAFEQALAPLARFGVPVENIVLALSLTLRLIPLMLGTVNEVLDARKARGAAFSITAFGTPVLIRSIRRARAIADALWARGAGD